MKKFLFSTVFCMCLCIGTSLSGADLPQIIPVTRQQNLSVAIYNGNIALVNDIRLAQLQSGHNQISYEDIAEQIIPESALLSGRGVQTLEQNFDYDLINTYSLLEKSVGNTVILQTTNSQTGETTRMEGKLIAFNDGPILEIGGKIFTKPEGTIILNEMPEGLIARPSLQLSVHSDNAGEQPLSLNYLTNGLSWEANYVARLNENETNMNLNGFITLNNQSASSFKRADVRLVSGEISLVRPPRVMQRKYAAAMETAVNFMADGAAPVVENVSDFYVYSLPYKTTIAPKQTKQVALLSKDLVPVQKDYVFDNELKPTLQPIENNKATVYYSFDNTKENKLGEALPKGNIRFYKNMANGDSVFVGEARLSHTPNQAHVRLRMSESFDVFANAKRIHYEQLGKDTSVSEYEIRIKNGSDELKTVTVYENFPGNWKITKTNQPYTNETANRVLWKINVPANGETLLTYTVQITR